MKKIFTLHWPIIGIIILWVLFSYPYFAKGLVPFPSSYLITSFPPWNATMGVAVKNNAMPDTISQIYPWKKLTIDSWKRGFTPLWNPYSFAGTGLAANYQSAVFSPLNILYFFLPFIDAWSLLVLLQPLVAGIGMYLLLRERSIAARVGSFIGSVSFMFCGFMVGWMAYGTLGWAASLLPWALWSISLYFSKGHWYAPILLTATIALSFVSGHFQISVYVLALASLYIVFLSVQYKKLSTAFFLFLHMLFGLLLVAPQLLLTYHAYTQSVRSLSFIKGEVIPWSYIVTIFSPDFYGNPVTRNDWFGHYAEWASYVGIIPLLLAIFAFASKRTKETLFFGCVAIVTLLLAYQSPLSDLLFYLKIPALSTSAASRILILTSFALSFLSAAGFSALQTAWRQKDRVMYIKFAVAVLLVVFGIWIVIFSLHPFAADKLAIAKRNLYLPTGITFAALGIFFVGYMRSKVLNTMLVLVLLLLTSFDMYRFAAKWMPFDEKKYVYPPVASIEYLRSHAGGNRVFGNIGNEVATTFGIQLIEGYDAMYQKRYGEFIQAASKGKILPPERSGVQFDKHGSNRDIVLQLLGVRYIYHRKSDVRAIWAFPFWEYEKAGTMKQIYADDAYWIYEYADAFPRVFLAGSYIVKKSDSEIIDTLFSRSLDLRETLILEKDPMPQKPQAGTGSAEIVSYEPNNIVIKTSSPVPKLLFLSDVYDTGWRATIDGKQRAEVLRADYDFRAVQLPKGDHTVVFTYRPSEYLFGIWLAIGSVISLIIGYITRFFIYENRNR